MTASRRTLIIVLVTAVASAAIAVTVMLALDSDSPSATSDSETTTSAAPAPEDQYIDALAASDPFPASTIKGKRDSWIQTGQSACRTLRETNGNERDTRLAISMEIGDLGGASIDSLAERSIAVVDAAAQYLCPEVAP